MAQQNGARAAAQHQQAGAHSDEHRGPEIMRRCAGHLLAGAQIPTRTHTH